MKENNDEERYCMDLNTEICMVIANAGESRSDSINAIECAKKGEYDKADELYEKAEKAYYLGHRGHKEILVYSSQNEEDFQLSYLLVHMSDILLSAEIMLDMAKYIIFILKEVNKNA